MCAIMKSVIVCIQLLDRLTIFGSMCDSNIEAGGCSFTSSNDSGGSNIYTTAVGGCVQSLQCKLLHNVCYFAVRSNCYVTTIPYFPKKSFQSCANKI